MIEIPSARLTQGALRGIVEEYILREGTDYGAWEISLQSKIEQVMLQLEKREVVITFDPLTENCTLLTSNQFNKISSEHRVTEPSNTDA
ncbi:MAG: YheU family protein [Porticoccaceae bacterium]|nr:YheU family protein [Porticoccaceae bacterium]MDG1474328.1 YheU family protein [Porticoccaceae bacterium]